MIYKIELRETEDFEIIHADSDDEAFKEADKIKGGYLNIFEIDEDYEEIRTIF